MGIKNQYKIVKMMTVNVNSETIQIPDKSNIRLLLEHLKMPDDGIAIALANNVVPKSEWETTCLKENQNILIIKATQGG